MTAVLHRLGYVHKKPRLIPGKADREAQERFLEAYDEIEKNKGRDDPKYLETSRIKLVFLPPYAPNLNLIERFWKFTKKKVLYNRYYETFDEFRETCNTFFKNPHKYQRELRSLLTANLELIG